MCAWLLSHVRLFAALWTVAHHTSAHGIFQARILELVAISYLPFLISYQGDVPNPGIETMFLASPALPGRFFTTAQTKSGRELLRSSA